METIKGDKLETFPLDLRTVADLISCDGPLVSLFESHFEDYYLYYWCDADENYNRWLIFRISNIQITSYLLGSQSLRDLILNPIEGYFFLCDVDNDWQYRNVYFVLSKNLPDIYTPLEDSYHDERLGLSQKDKSILEHKFITPILQHLSDKFAFFSQSQKVIKMPEESGSISQIKRMNDPTSSQPTHLSV